jgi:hypothetical protein
VSGQGVWRGGGGSGCCMELYTVLHGNQMGVRAGGGGGGARFLNTRTAIARV